jgi:hypothetical protein
VWEHGVIAIQLGRKAPSAKLSNQWQCGLRRVALRLYHTNFGLRISRREIRISSQIFRKEATAPSSSLIPK